MRKMRMKDGFVYPGGARRAISFTIDDGNVPMDRKFIEILKPHGILGTFNLCSDHLSHLTPEEYVEFYRGYEIANHCKAHPSFLREEWIRPVSNENFDPQNADVNKMYPHEKYEGVYRYHFERGWRLVAEREAYIRLVKECTPELEQVFGEGSVKSFVWPNGDQKDGILQRELESLGFYGIRKTGRVADTTAFALPADRNAWSYNADTTNLLECARKFEAEEDDGTLKFFSFGVHSVDFERDNKWEELKEFAKEFGNRRDDFYYASIGDIFDYENRVKKCTVENGVLYNGSDREVYYLQGGEVIILGAGQRKKLN